LESRNKYDAILIGSGLGSLTAGALLTLQQKRKILILERHSKVGGFTHVFKRQGKYTWDVGLHYVGEMNAGSMPRMIFDYITAGALQWNKIPDPYDTFIYPGNKIELFSGRKNFTDTLIKVFPEEAEAIRQYVSDVFHVVSVNMKNIVLDKMYSGLSILNKPFSSPRSKYLHGTLEEYCQYRFRNKQLAAIISSQWGNYGLPPESASFLIHSIIATHYINGGYYPAGGSKSIPDTISAVILKHGGTIKVNSRVSRIIVENNTAAGVVVLEKKENGFSETEYYSDCIISGAGARITFGELLRDPKSFEIISQINSLKQSTGTVTAYLGLSENPSGLGLNGGNIWIYDSYDHNKNFANRNLSIEGKPQLAYVSFPSVRSGTEIEHTAEIISFMDYEVFAKWADNPCKKRGEDYEDLKNKIMDKLIDLVESKIPGFASKITYKELSTPLTTEHYSGNKFGYIYGIPSVPERKDLKFISNRTHIKNLYLTGADSGTHGIAGALFSGVFAAAEVIGKPKSLIKIFSEAKKFKKRSR